MADPLHLAPVTARMSCWMVVGAFGEEFLFGFADEHPRTGGLSWVLSTRIVELSRNASRARTASGRLYSLGCEISARDLDDEGRTALRVLLVQDDHPGRADDIAWLTARKMARHLHLTPPPRSDLSAVIEFMTSHRDAYLARRRAMLADLEPHS